MAFLVGGAGVGGASSQLTLGLEKYRYFLEKSF